jgi:hypothetical protein
MNHVNSQRRSENKFIFNLSGIPLLLSIVSTTTQAGIVSSDELFYSLLIWVRILCYQTSCHDSFPPRYRSSLNLWPPGLKFRARKKMTITRQRNPVIWQSLSALYEIICHVNLFSDRKSCMDFQPPTFFIRPTQTTKLVTSDVRYTQEVESLLSVRQ